ncbi:YdcF family protein [Brevundimonas sp.]|uniref:YdcF family protein n=1 Tax=Brevundimonas sp. TaxID=1871086 RepID=UPI002D325FB1|nr:YdcF family protein [Brevundimonas sp.]HYC98928.1 YdcF family protein [Brevundimonas sp.]
MKRIRNGLLAAATASGGLFALSAGLIVADGLTDDIRPSDAAVVLGSKANPDGTLSPRLAARTGRALDLYEDGWVQVIIVSGGTGREGVPEGTAMKRWLVARGVPATAIIVDDLGVDTMATARNAAGILRARDLHTAIVVSQYFHISRTRLAFAKQGLPGVGSAHPDWFESRDLYSIAREVPGYAKYLLEQG